MIIPPILGINIYFVPERKALHGIEIILMKRLGRIIFKIVLPPEKSCPNSISMRSLKKSKIKQVIEENKKSIKNVCLKILTIFFFAPSPNSLENSGRN